MEWNITLIIMNFDFDFDYYELSCYEIDCCNYKIDLQNDRPLGYLIVMKPK